MAIPTTENIDLCVDVRYAIYGDIPTACVSLSQALCSTNILVPNSLRDFAGCSASLTTSLSDLTWDEAGNCCVIITAKSAWCIVLTNTVTPAIYSIVTTETGGKVTLDGTLGADAVYGGSGSVSIFRNAISCSYTPGTLTIYYSNGAGGRTSQAISLMTFY